MPKPELYVIFTGNKGRKPDKISLSKEFFEGADIDIEVKAKVICKDRNVLKEYLLEREKEVVTIMMSLFDEEQIMKSFIRSERHEAAQENARETVKRMIKIGKLSLDEIALCVPSLSLDELRELEVEVMQLA